MGETVPCRGADARPEAKQKYTRTPRGRVVTNVCVKKVSARIYKSVYTVADGRRVETRERRDRIKCLAEH